MKKILAITGSFGAVVAFAATVWGLSTFWVEYCNTEANFEREQAEAIADVRETAFLAMQQSGLAIAQQRAAWLEQQLFFYENTYQCQGSAPNGKCNGRVFRTYLNHLREYDQVQKQIQKYLRGGS